MSAETTPIVESKATTQNTSRQALEGELHRIGVNADFFKTLTVDQLADLLFGLNRAVSANASSVAAKQLGKKIGGVGLSAIDKKILRAILESKGNPSSLQLSRALDIPISTVQRRRRRLEEEFVHESYGLRYEKFGKRLVTFIVSYGAGNKNSVADEILGLEKVVTVSRVFGDNADLKVEALLEGNREFMEMSEKIRAIHGIQKISWFESLEELGRKKEIDLSIIESC